MKLLHLILAFALALPAFAQKEALQRAVGTNVVTGSLTSAPFQVTTIAALKAVIVSNSATPNGTQVYVTGYYAAGDGGQGYFVYNSASVAADNGGTIIQPTAGVGRWLRVVTTNDINVRWFGAKGDGITNDTTSIQSSVSVAVAAGGAGVYIPRGRYLTNTITLGSNVNLFGEGIGSTVLVQNSITGASYGTLFADSGSASTYVENLSISEITIDGQVASAGFEEHTHLVSLSGVRNAAIRRVEFLGFRGDGLYLGSSPSAGIERHNINTVIDNCVFDGVNKDNRNGISVIDSDGLSVSNCLFKRCTKSTMPGAIDVEPDSQAFHVIRNITVEDSIFSDIGGNNGVVSVYFNSATLTAAATNFTFRNLQINTFSTIAVSFINTTNVALTDASNNHNVLISGVRANNGTRGIELIGAKGVIVKDCVFSQTSDSSLIGYTAPSNKCYNILIDGVTFDRSGSVSGIGVEVFTVSGLQFNNCVFSDCGAGVPGSANALDFNAGTSDNVAIFLTKFVAPTGKTQIAIQKEAAHTFTASSNTFSANQLNGLANNFAAAGQQNIPNWYEQGTWVPTIEGDAGTNVNTYTIQVGTFTRIGRVVTAQFYVAISAKDAGMAGGVQVGGLPYAAQSLTNGFYSGSVSNYTGITLSASYTQVGIAAIQTLTKARVYQNGSGQTSAQIVPSALAATTYIIGTIIYQTN